MAPVMNTRKYLVGLILLTLVAGCTSDWDPERTAPVDTIRATARAGAAMSRPRTDTFAALPDRGELLAYDSKRPARHRGSFTSHPVHLSEEHAFRASHEGGELVVTAPDGQPLRFRYERHVEHPDGNWSWIGRDAEGRDAVLTFGEKAVFGNIPHGEQEPLRVTTMAGSAWLVTTDRSKLPPDINRATTRDGEPDYLVPPELAASLVSSGSGMSMAAAQDVSAKAASSAIDLVIGYTDGYANQLGGASQAVTRLSNLVDIANLALDNSEVSRRIRFVDAVQVSYPDATDNAEALQELTGYSTETGSGIPVPAALQPLRDAREESGGDLVSLVRAFRTPENNGCGIAWLIGGGQTPFTADDAPFGYSVVSDGTDEDEDDISYVCRSESLAHELGHNLGQAHNEEGSVDSGVHAYSYGYREASATGFYTVMAYRLASSSQVAINYYANPAVSFNGRPTGVANASDNARSMNQTMPIVAAFRASQVTGFIRNDVDGDGQSDLLLRLASPSDNRFGYWITDGATVRRTWSTAIGGAYHIVATGDFNGDGRLDLVWTSAQRDLKLWLGDGISFGASQNIRTLPVGWEVIGAGDVDDDGKSDLLLRFASTTHKIGYWIMDGATVKRTWSIPTGGTYQVVATGDFNADGHLDLVWIGAQRDLKLWAGTGTSFGSSQNIRILPSGWQVIGAGDVDGDSRSDLLLSYASTEQNRFGYWIMNGATVGRTRSTRTSQAYQIAARGDFNGDGRQDIVWTSSERDLKLWLGNGTSFGSSQLIGNYPPGWSVLNPGL